MGMPYKGMILWVNLTRGTLDEETIPTALYKQQLSGLGLAVAKLLKHIPPGADPLGPENVIVVAPGPLTGTFLPSSGKCSACRTPVGRSFTSWIRCEPWRDS